MRTTITALAAFASLASAHFNLDFPKARDFDEDKLGEFPCGSFNTPSDTRVSWPISGGQIALTMGHIEANVEVFIGLGNDPGSTFNTILRPIFQETGLGDFCMTGFTIPDGLNVTEGTNATIQVVTNGDPDGGLYNCADITFSSTVALQGSDVCKNGTGVAASAATVSGMPNGTTSTATTTSGTAAAASSTKPGAASGLKVGISGLLVTAGAAFAMAL
jgi:hypothetical protein